jgi:hypothetical protein
MQRPSSFATTFIFVIFFSLLAMGVTAGIHRVDEAQKRILATYEQDARADEKEIEHLSEEEYYDQMASDLWDEEMERGNPNGLTDPVVVGCTTDTDCIQKYGRGNERRK